MAQSELPAVAVGMEEIPPSRPRGMLSRRHELHHVSPALRTSRWHVVPHPTLRSRPTARAADALSDGRDQLLHPSSERRIGRQSLVQGSVRSIEVHRAASAQDARR